MPPFPAGTTKYRHRARFWRADPANNAMSFDTPACHAWQSRVTHKQIDREADRRIDKAYSPDDRSRAARVRDEMPEGPEKAGLRNRVGALRSAAQALKDTLVAKTPEEVRLVGPTNDNHWPE